jgi:NADH dehydrogenase
VDKYVVVAGGSGFIGRYVVQKLTEKGFRVLAPVRDLDKAQKVLGKHESVLLLDLNNPFLERVFKKYSPEVFINLVGILKEDKKQGITIWPKRLGLKNSFKFPPAGWIKIICRDIS